jgi:alkylresorcinol/alkylpyrone synthase
MTAAGTRRELEAMLPATTAARFVRMVEAGQNETRYHVLPLDQTRRLDTLESRNTEFREHAVRLGEMVARDALRKARAGADEISAIIGVSSTGHLMPSLETHLIQRLRLPAHCRRVPLTQLGCAGGAAGLALAAALGDGAPGGKVLVVSVELPSLSFPSFEPSPSDLLAATQFGDGAAAAVVAGGQAARGPAILAAGSVLFPDTIDSDGVRLTTAGLRLVRPRGLAQTLHRQLGNAVDQFLGEHGLVRNDIGFWVVHPRNPELLEAAAASLQLPPAMISASHAVWRRTGNLISAAVFHVLRELSTAMPPPAGARGMMLAFGAGFGCEMVLMRAAGWLCGAPAVPERASAPSAPMGAV